MPSIPWASYLRADHLILHSLESYFHADHLTLHSLTGKFRTDHLTLHPSVPLAGYFCAIHPLEELFSCRLFNSPFARPFGELILYRPSLGQVIFVSSIAWAHYFRADYLTLHPSINLASYFYQLFKSPSYIRMATNILL